MLRITLHRDGRLYDTYKFTEDQVITIGRSSEAMIHLDALGVLRCAATIKDGIFYLYETKDDVHPVPFNIKEEMLNYEIPIGPFTLLIEFC